MQQGLKLIKQMQSGEMFSSYQVITPEKAKQMLELMPKNRRINKLRMILGLMPTE